MAHILGIGIATIDIINDVDGYPREDDEVRARAQHVCRGGNAANTLVVLSQLGHHCDWCGVLADDDGAAFVERALRDFGIDSRLCQRAAAGTTPTSYITRNCENGSRTIVHYRDLPELDFDHFRRLDLHGYDWLHFEGRNIVATERMMAHVRQHHPDLPLSLEVEKSRPGIETLFPHADLLLFSRHYVLATDGRQTTPQAFLERLHTRLPRQRLVCAWGEAGAWGLDRDGALHHSKAFPPARIVDTLGAGDTFNAAIIDACVREESLATALSHGCRIAGRKCGHSGLDFLHPPAGRNDTRHTEP